jgi:hypothetical protein
MGPLTNTEVVDANLVEQGETTSLTVHGADPTGFLQIIRTAAENKTDPATMRELLNVYKDAQAQRAEEAYAEAIVQFRRMVRPIVMTGHRDDTKTKNRNNEYGTVKYDWAELTTTIEQIQACLDQCQLTPTWRAMKDELNYVSLECIVTHVLKHKESSGPFGSAVGEGRRGQTPVQVRQGVVTSLKRATLFMVLGLTTKEDDRDLENAEQGQEEKKPQSQDAITDPEAGAKSRFKDLCWVKAGVKFNNKQLWSILDKVKSASGKMDVAGCVSWLESEYVLLGKDGTIAVQSDGQADANEDGATDPTDGEPAWDQATADSADMPYECDECRAKYAVKPAGGKCLTKGCFGQVVKVKE